MRVSVVRAEQVVQTLARLASIVYYVSLMKSTSVIHKSRKKMGRPPKLGEKRAGIYPMRLPDEVITAVDAFAEREGMKTRSEAFRRLVEIGLAASKPALPSRSRPAKGSKREGGS